MASAGNPLRTIKEIGEWATPKASLLSSRLTEVLAKCVHGDPHFPSRLVDPLPFRMERSDDWGRRGGGRTESDDRTASYDIGFKLPPKHTQFQKGVSRNPYGRKVDRHFVESTFHKILFSVVAPSREHRGPTCPHFEAMVRAVISKAIEGDVAAFREIVEGTREIGMESPFETRKLSLELQNHPMESRKRQSGAG